ncbi:MULTISPECIES: fumarylacetoacetate hydrolase family protein [unclassified Microbacterium]|uniref:fumarylacetoacetate hydrolase family protein n=1 Tax=unclassified Microbacterium TaxID=2609290 RepID=UPI003016854C
MSVSLLRSSEGWWIDRGDRAEPYPTSARTTGELMLERDDILAAATRAAGDGVPIADLDLLSPITAPCRVVAQMVNYRSHAVDSGIDPDTVPTTFFRKASGSIAPARAVVTRPPHVGFLDYEIELGLVFHAPLDVGGNARLEDVVGALVMADDLSARDVQLTKTQFYESKSYPGFTPLGPRLVVLAPGEHAYLQQDLRLTLSVNGVTRQDRTVADMITPPQDALGVLQRFQRMDPGDVLLTGTPGGTALKAPPAIVEKIAALLPAPVKWRAFFRSQERNTRYLQDGDVVESTIVSSDGRLDLGRQELTVRDAS